MRRSLASGVVPLVLIAALAGCADPDRTSDGAVAPVPRETGSDASPDDSRPPARTPSTVAADTGGDVGDVVPVGFDRVAAQVTTATGEVCDLCLWLADDAGRRAAGLMSVTDLGPADGMAFVYDEPTTSRFWMKDTVLPLSIAFFASDGAFLDAFDMEPCTVDPCTRYPTAPDFLVAVETLQGELDELGMTAGSRLVLLDRPCER